MTVLEPGRSGELVAFFAQYRARRPQPGGKNEKIRLLYQRSSDPRRAECRERAALAAVTLSAADHVLPACPNYGMIDGNNLVRFTTEAAAQQAGYRKAKSCP